MECPSHQPRILPVLPDIAYDSYLTIGAEDGSYASAYQCSGQWGASTCPKNSTTTARRKCLVERPGRRWWYGLFPGLEEADVHPAFAGDDLRVMVAQLTTAGEVSGQIQVQIFQNGSQANEYRQVLPILTKPSQGVSTPRPSTSIQTPTSTVLPCAITSARKARASIPNFPAATSTLGLAKRETHNNSTLATSTSTRLGGWTSQT